MITRTAAVLGLFLIGAPLAGCVVTPDHHHPQRYDYNDRRDRDGDRHHRYDNNRGHHDDRRHHDERNDARYHVMR